MDLNINIINFENQTKIVANPNDTIQQVKQKIKGIHDNIEVNDQELYLGNQKLENEKRLSDYNIENSERIRLVRTLTSGYQIYVNNGRSTSLQVLPSYNIEKVKELYEHKIGFSAKDQRFIFNGKELENFRTLSEYNIREADILNLVSRLYGGFI